MSHNHLIAAYVITFGLQLSYLGWLFFKSQQLKSTAARLKKK